MNFTTETYPATEAMMARRLRELNQKLNHWIRDFTLIFNVNFVLAGAMVLLGWTAQLSPNNAFLAWILVRDGYSANLWSWLLGIFALFLFAFRPRGTLVGFILTWPLLILVIYQIDYVDGRDPFQIALHIVTLIFIIVIYFFNSVIEDLKRAVFERQKLIQEQAQQIILLQAALEGGKPDAAAVPSSQ